MVRSCPACQQKNRVRAADLLSQARCGACKTLLPTIAEPIDADPDVFDDVVAHAPVPVLVDFWAAWCGPCRMAAPFVKDVAHDMAGRALVLKVDTEAHPELSARYGVRSIPNFIVCAGGRVVSQHAGLARPEQMRHWLEAAGAKPV